MLGVIIPMSQFYQFLQINGMDFILFSKHLFANYISTFFALDLVLSSIVFSIWVIVESKRIKMSSSWIYIIINLLVGLSVAFPYFLYVRETKIKLNSDTNV